MRRALVGDALGAFVAQCAQIHLSEQLKPGWLGNAKITTDFAGEMIVDFRMARNRTALTRRMRPPRMAAAFAEQAAIMCEKMRKKIAPLHTAIGSSS